MKILVVQTAFIGDVVLATALLESLYIAHPNASLDILVKKGHESLFKGHPFLNKVYVFDKKESRIKELWRLIKQIRSNKYDTVINIHRFLSSGILTACSGANRTIGFRKNPLAWFFTHAYDHSIDVHNTQHEIDRNQQLIQTLVESRAAIRPKLYPSKEDKKDVPSENKYICIAPASVWYTKQWPAAKWIELINKLPKNQEVYLLGGPDDREYCQHIVDQTANTSVSNLSGELSFLASVAWMENATMNYVNDSAPLHFASAVNAPVTAIFCSTVPAFGFGPLSDNNIIWETHEKLTCRPCGLHGKKTCPEGHFRCSEIEV